MFDATANVRRGTGLDAVMYWCGMRRLFVLGALSVLAACTDVTAPSNPTSATPPASATIALTVASPPSQFTPIQAQGAATVVAFLNAYNAGDLSSALALLTDTVIVTDCDYRSATANRFDGKNQVVTWLQQRIADHDNLVLQVQQPGVPNVAGSFAMAISYERRTSDTLRSLGFPSGITPRLATKAILMADGRHLDAFVNAGSATDCQS